jgi:hypothetical protein
MPLDSLEFTQPPLLAKLGRVERLLATEQQWCKGRLRDGDGRHCLVGAIEAADAWKEIAPIILRAVREVSGKRYWRIESFNDDPCTTHGQVLAVLRMARQNIIAGIAKDCEGEPWHRRWAQVLKRLHTGPAMGKSNSFPEESVGHPGATRLIVPQPGTPPLRLVMREEEEVS